MHRKSVYFLLATVLAMLALGIVMLFSTAAFAQDSHGDPTYFVKRQSIWLGVGILVCLVSSRIDYHFWQKSWTVLFGLAVILLILCFVPPIGMKINGAWRWVNFRVITFQPSEFAKFAAIVFLAYWFARVSPDGKGFIKGFAWPLGGASVLMALIAPEADLGTTALIGATTFIVMFVAGTSILYIGSLAAVGVGGFTLAIMKMPERLGRMLAFLYPEKFPADAYQAQQGLIALGSGGVEGLGLGMGRQKMSYLPFAHTDFIFPVIGEELGLRVTLLIIIGYLIIILCGALISMQARDRFGMLLGFGIVTMIALQAAVNIGVTTSLLPNKGLPLPFISYGGSNLVFCLLGIGILVNIFLQGHVEATPDRMAVRMRARMTPRI